MIYCVFDRRRRAHRDMSGCNEYSKFLCISCLFIWTFILCLQYNHNPTSLKLPTPRDMIHRAKTPKRESNNTRKPSFIVNHEHSGGLGNQMASYATIYAMKKLYGLRPIFSQWQKNVVKPYFSVANTFEILEELLPNWRAMKWERPFRWIGMHDSLASRSIVKKYCKRFTIPYETPFHQE